MLSAALVKDGLSVYTYLHPHTGDPDCLLSDDNNMQKDGFPSMVDLPTAFHMNGLPYKTENQ